MRKLTILIPCYNEVSSIAKVIESVKALEIDKEILVVDNHSDDGTREVLRSMCAPEPKPEMDATGHAGCTFLRGDGFSAVLRDRNHGKGASVRLGILLAQSEYIICQDADLEYSPSDIVRLLELAETERAAAVFGARRLPCWYQSVFSLGRTLLGALFRFSFRTRIRDVATCYKLLRLDVARQLELVSNDFDLDFEIAAKLVLYGYCIEQAAVSYSPRDHRNGKKIRYRDGLSASWLFLKYWLHPPMRPT